MSKGAAIGTATPRRLTSYSAIHDAMQLTDWDLPLRFVEGCQPIHCFGAGAGAAPLSVDKV